MCLNVERPVLFNALMVQAILEKRKNQTRRLVTNRILKKFESDFHAGKCLAISDANFKTDPHVLSYCPFGKVGDHLWVRETWQIIGDPASLPCPSHHLIYKADYPECVDPRYKNIIDIDQVKFKPSIHMSRWMSRILLEITEIRIERLNDISRQDAVKEGLHELPASGRYAVSKGDQYFGGASHDPREVFGWLWDSINNEDTCWDMNPWVWVVKFKRVPTLHGE